MGGVFQPCGLREAKQTPPPARVPLPEPLLSSSPGVVRTMYLCRTYNQDATSILPIPHWLPLSPPTLQLRGPMLLNLPPTLCDSFLPPWGIPGKRSYGNFRAKMLTKCRQTPTPLKDQFMRTPRVYRVCVPFIELLRGEIKVEAKRLRPWAVD